MVLELRPAHDPTKPYGFVGVVVSTADLSASVWLWQRGRQRQRRPCEKVIEIPAEPAEAEQLPPALQAVRRRPAAVTDIALSVDDRYLYVSCWGTGELKRYDVSDPRNPRETGSRALGGIVRRAPHPAAGAVNGGPQMVEVSRDGAPRLPDQLAVRLLGRAVLSRGHRRLDGQARRRPRRRL